MDHDTARAHDAGMVGGRLAGHDGLLRWGVDWNVAKYWGDERERGPGIEPYEVVRGEGNLLTYGGMSCLLQSLIGNGTATTGQALTFFSASNARIGVGDSNTAAAATQTDLQASTNKLRKLVDSVSHTDATTSGAAVITFVATFATTDANYAWEEWGIFNAATGGRMLNRKVQSLGTKTSAASWTFTVTITLS